MNIKSLMSDQYDMHYCDYSRTIFVLISRVIHQLSPGPVNECEFIGRDLNQFLKTLLESTLHILYKVGLDSQY
jgi:hypothetical protein